MPSWYVITGTLSSGKSTLINELALRGYQTVPEAARVLIDRYRAQGISAKQLRNSEVAERLFQQKVLQMKLSLEQILPRDRVIFFDRGMPDSIAYYHACGLDARELEPISRGRYRKIFFLQELPMEEDYARVEDTDTAREISRLLKQSYLDLGYDVVDVPVLLPEERADFVLTYVG